MTPPKLEFAFGIQIKLSPKIDVGMTQKGAKRAFVNIIEGTVNGPNIKGKVLPGAGDWALIRPDGVLDFDARYNLETDDGCIIYMQNRGFRWGSAEVMAKMARREPVDPSEYYMRTSPYFETPIGKYDWMMKYVFVGVGDKIPEGNIINYYKVL